MRKDMKDVIVNTGRQGGGWGKKLYNRAYLRDHDPDDLPIRLPIARRRQYSDPKSLGDRIAPLRAFGTQRRDAVAEALRVRVLATAGDRQPNRQVVRVVVAEVGTVVELLAPSTALTPGVNDDILHVFTHSLIPPM